MPKDSFLDHVLNEVFGDLIGGIVKAKLATDAINKLAEDYKLGKTGTQLLAMAYQLRDFAKQCIDDDGEVEPTLWIIDNEDRQWALSAEVTNSDYKDDRHGMKAMAMLLKKLDATSYLIVREATVVKLSMDMTLLEKKAARDDPANLQTVVSLIGEAIDGTGLTISYLREPPDNKIDIDMPYTSIVAPKWEWKPHGSQFADTGLVELLPRPELCGTCLEPILPDPLTGTTCACARKGGA